MQPADIDPTLDMCTRAGWTQAAVEFKVCPTLLHMSSAGNRTPDPLILSPKPYPVGYMFPVILRSLFRLSRFAEVTIRGCEVIYDSCPRAFAGDLWWRRTEFGNIAEEACPRGTVGTATRNCTEEGWQEPTAVWMC